MPESAAKTTRERERERQTGAQVVRRYEREHVVRGHRYKPQKTRVSKFYMCGSIPVRESHERLVVQCTGTGVLQQAGVTCATCDVETVYRKPPLCMQVRLLVQGSCVKTGVAVLHEHLPLI